MKSEIYSHPHTGAKADAAYRRVKRAVEDAESMGFAGLPLTGDALVVAEIADQRVADGRLVLNVIRRAYANGITKRGRT